MYLNRSASRDSIRIRNIYDKSRRIQTFETLCLNHWGVGCIMGELLFYKPIREWDMFSDVPWYNRYSSARRCVTDIAPNSKYRFVKWILLCAACGSWTETSWPEWRTQSSARCLGHRALFHCGKNGVVKPKKESVRKLKEHLNHKYRSVGTLAGKAAHENSQRTRWQYWRFIWFAGQTLSCTTSLTCKYDLWLQFGTCCKSRETRELHVFTETSLD